MTFEAALRSQLVTVTGLNNKVFPINAPEGTATPYLVYLTGLPNYDKTLDGFEKSQSITAELNIIDNNQTSLRALSKEVQQLVMSLERAHLAEGGPFIDEVELSQGMELYEAQADLYRRVFEATFYFKEE